MNTVTGYTHNRTGTRIHVVQRFPRRRTLGSIHRTAKGHVFVPKARVTAIEMEGIRLYMSTIK